MLIEYVMREQSNLSCCIGNSEEVPDKQKRIIKELGLKFKGKNQWLYFEAYKKQQVKVDFESGAILTYESDEAEAVIDMIIDFVLERGRPKQIRSSQDFVQTNCSVITVVPGTTVMTLQLV